MHSHIYVFCSFSFMLNFFSYILGFDISSFCGDRSNFPAAESCFLAVHTGFDHYHHYFCITINNNIILGQFLNMSFFCIASSQSSSSSWKGYFCCYYSFTGEFPTPAIRETPSRHVYYLFYLLSFSKQKRKHVDYVVGQCG